MKPEIGCAPKGALENNRASWLASKVRNGGLSFTPGFSPVSGATKNQETVLTVFLMLRGCDLLIFNGFIFRSEE